MNLKQDEWYWWFQTYRGTNLYYDMLSNPTSSDSEEKEVYNLIVDRPVNQNKLSTKIEKLLLCQKCAQEKGLYMKV